MMAGMRDLHTLDQGCLSAKLVCPPVVIHQLHQSGFMACKVTVRMLYRLFINLHAQCTETLNKRDNLSTGCSPAQSQLLSHPERVATKNSPKTILKKQERKSDLPKRPKGNLFRSPSIKLNLGLSLFSLFHCPVERRILETSA